MYRNGRYKVAGDVVECGGRSGVAHSEVGRVSMSTVDKLELCGRKACGNGTRNNCGQYQGDQCVHDHFSARRKWPLQVRGWIFRLEFATATGTSGIRRLIEVGVTAFAEHGMISCHGKHPNLGWKKVVLRASARRGRSGPVFGHRIAASVLSSLQLVEKTRIRARHNRQPER